MRTGRRSMLLAPSAVTDRIMSSVVGADESKLNSDALFYREEELIS